MKTELKTVKGEGIEDFEITVNVPENWAEIGQNLNKEPITAEAAEAKFLKVGITKCVTNKMDEERNKAIKAADAKKVESLKKMSAQLTDDKLQRLAEMLNEENDGEPLTIADLKIIKNLKL